MKKCFLGLVCLFLFIIFNFQKSFCFEKRIITEGRSTLANLDIEKARDRAIEDALRKAVEQGVGTYISSQSITENYRLIYDRILANSFGYVREYKIINERKQDGFYIVKISCIVKRDDIKRDLQAIGLLLERKNLPRLIVLIKEKLMSKVFSGKDSSYFFLNQSQVEASMASAFLTKGFYVIDSTSIKESREREQAIRAIQGDTRAASLLGNLMNADIVLIGEAYSKKSGQIAGSHLISVAATLTLKAIRSDTGEILAANTWNSAGAGLNDIAASNNAAKRISSKASDKMISDVLNKFVSETGSTHVIQLMVYNITNFSHLDFLEKSLKNWIPGIETLYRRSFERGVAILDARVKGDSDMVASAIQKKVFGKFKVVVTGFSKNMIKLTIVQHEQKNIKENVNE